MLIKIEKMDFDELQFMNKDYKTGNKGAGNYLRRNTRHSLFKSNVPMKLQVGSQQSNLVSSGSKSVLSDSNAISSANNIRSSNYKPRRGKKNDHGLHDEPYSNYHGTNELHGKVGHGMVKSVVKLRNLVKEAQTLQSDHMKTIQKFQELRQKNKGMVTLFQKKKDSSDQSPGIRM